MVEQSSEQLCHLKGSNRLAEFYVLMTKLHDDWPICRDRADSLGPIRDVFESWVATLVQSFVPYENVTIDEQLVGFRGHCPFRQYISLSQQGTV